MEQLFTVLLWSLLGIAALVAIMLRFVTAPYGRFSRNGWGPLISSTVGWVVMESPAVLTITLMYLFSDRLNNVTVVVCLLIWQTHYMYRTYVFPFKRKGNNRKMPVSVVAMAMFFNVWNGFLNGAWLFFVGPVRDISWLYSIPFIVGTAIFFVGMFINRQSDNILIRLRAPGESGYKIPYGGLFRFVSMPAYFGELVEWCGFAILTWSPAGAAFAVFTAANLIPRAISNHKWYKNTFPEYPAERKAVIPFLL
ncbi:MAG: DUF1295 domain-containing protein [Deltaproteobacteria bacterium]|nr:DUF1295 domain-containing protein [Deltaproteobacteria bacterium]MBN2670993.1 DUF1295 domain-containing protein [Deltaproteobacteria bacterium]